MKTLFKILLGIACSGCSDDIITPPAHQIKVDATDSGIYFNQYEHGEKTVIYGPVPIYDSILHWRCDDSLTMHNIAIGYQLLVYGE